MTLPKKTIFKITYGYRATDFVLIDNSLDLQKAIYAKVERIPVTLGGKVLSGQEIKTIEPDIHSYTGWNRAYNPTDPDDFAQIERDVPQILGDLINQANQHVNKLVEGGRNNEIGRTPLPALNQPDHEQ